MTGKLERRLRQLRSRMLIRSWDYRQRRHARGVWFRFRRALADASEAYVVEASEAREVVAEGFPVDPVGAELAPPKLVVRISASRAAALATARPVPLRLAGELLSAEHLVLVPFEPDETPSQPR